MKLLIAGSMVLSSVLATAAHAAVISETPPGTSRTNVEVLCGTLYGFQLDVEGQRHQLELPTHDTAFEDNQDRSTIHQRFDGNPVCVHDVVLQVQDGAMPRLYLDSTDQLSLDPDRPLEDVSASNCELFIDQLVPVYTFHRFSKAGPYSSLETRMYLKVKRDRLDAPVRAVRFYGFEHTSGTTAPTQLYLPLTEGRLVEGTNDTYEMINVFEASREGAFYVETEAGTRYWLNAEGAPYAFFNLGVDHVHNLEPSIGVYGDHPQARPLDLATVPHTADAAPELNPFGCR